MLIIPIFITTACQNIHEENNKVFTTIYPIQFIVDEIGGDTIEAESVYPPGVDAHTYEPSSKTMTSIAKGKAFIYLGAGMESFAETAANSLENQDVQLIELAQLDESLFSSTHHHSDDGHHHGDKDPHIWLDPLRMIQMGELIKNELIHIFPSHKDTFTANFKTFSANMKELDEDFSRTMQAKSNKKILVAHAAYGYWEERYGLEQLSISGLSTNDTPSQKDLTRIVELAKKNNLQYVIFEQAGTDKVADIIREQINGDALYIHNLESLTEKDINNGDDYISLMKQNLKTLDKATY